MLVLAEPVSQEQLSEAANRINNLCRGMDADGLAGTTGGLSTLEKDVIKLITGEIQRSGAILGGEVYRDGLTNVLAEPEFAEVDVARRALRVLEERTFLEDLLSRTVLTTGVGGIQVLIGGEDTWEELRECSVILARYGAPGLATGALGVLGPIRMAYGRTISTVRFVAGLLSDLVLEMHLE
jgi:heat-inducible transcriptional repressor